MRLAYQGEPGAYSEAAALHFAGPQAEYASLFGEMTFYPDSGTGRFRPHVYDEFWGRLWPQVPACRQRRGIDSA